MKTYFNTLITLMALLAITFSSSGCSPGLSREDAEKEIVAFMLDNIIQGKLEGNANYLQSSGEPWLETSVTANIITFSPPNDAKEKNPWEYLKSSEPIKVWWYFDNKLIEVTDKGLGQQKWQEYYMNNSDSHSWPIASDFGILSMSNGNTKATIYVDFSSCSECALGFISTLERNDSGMWEIIDTELLWVS